MPYILDLSDPYLVVLISVPVLTLKWKLGLNSLLRLRLNSCSSSASWVLVCTSHGGGGVSVRLKENSIVVLRSDHEHKLHFGI